MAQVILENIYKSFPHRKGEQTLTPTTAETLQLSGKEDGSQTTDSSSPPSGSLTILRRINLTVNDGEFMVLVGPSGCGKSTLLRTIAGLEELTGGKIWVGDTLVNDLPPKERDIAMVFQNYALYPHLTVYDNIAFGLRRTKLGSGAADVRMGSGQKHPVNPVNPVNPDGAGKKIPEWVEDLLVGVTRNLPKGIRYMSEKEKAVHEKVRRVAQLLQIESLLHRLPKQLSGGQKQRVALGRAIARNPQVFLMDEPLSNLDAKLRTETRSQIVQLQRQLATTTIYVTHDQTEAMTMGDRIAVMNRGEIQQIAPPLELYNHPVNKFVAEFIGSPPMNFIMVLVKAPHTIHHSQFRLTLPENWSPFLAKYNGLLLFLGIRPEHLILGVPAPRNLQVEVELVEALGNDTYISVALRDSSPLQVRIPPDQPVKIGERIWLSIAAEKIHLFDPQTSRSILFDS